jgi:hypothetical protein
LLLHAIVHPADIQDRDGGILLLATLFGMYPFLQTLFADAGYQGRQFHNALKKILPHLRTQIVKRSDQAKGFVDKFSPHRQGPLRMRSTVLEANDVPFAPVQGLQDVLDDPQVRHLGTFYQQRQSDRRMNGLVHRTRSTLTLHRGRLQQENTETPPTAQHADAHHRDIPPGLRRSQRLRRSTPETLHRGRHRALDAGAGLGSRSARLYDAESPMAAPSAYRCPSWTARKLGDRDSTDCPAR